MGEAGQGTRGEVPTHTTTIWLRLGAGPPQPSCHSHPHSTHNVPILLTAPKAAGMPGVVAPGPTQVAWGLFQHASSKIRTDGAWAAPSKLTRTSQTALPPLLLPLSRLQVWGSFGFSCLHNPRHVSSDPVGSSAACPGTAQPAAAARALPHLCPHGFTSCKAGAQLLSGVCRRH